MRDYIPPPSGIGAGARAWCYLRDSGGEAQEMSVTQQTTVIKSYCGQSGLTLTRAFADEAKSGTTDAGRDSFHDMIYLAEHDDGARPDILLVWSLSRFGRNFDDSQYYRAKLRKSGVVVHSLTDSIPEGKWGRVVESMIDASNQDKSEQTSRDVRRALADMVKQGFAAGGFPPQGYKREIVIIGTKRNGQPRQWIRWIPDSDLWELVILAWALRAEGKSYRDIQDATGGKVFKSKSCWVSFFQNKSYLGVGKCGDLEVPDHHPAAVDRATWDKVQAITQKHRLQQRHAPKADSPALLSNLAECVHCGDKMFYGSDSKHKKRRGWPYYMCGRKTRYSAASCEGRRVDARKAEMIVLDTVLTRILTPDYARALLDELQAQFTDAGSTERKAERLQKQIAECDRAINNLLELAETFGAQSAGERLRGREAERARLMAESNQLQAERAAAQIEITPDALAAVLNAWRNQIIEARDSSDARALRGLLARFVNKIELGYNRARVYYQYPLMALAQPSDPQLWGHFLHPVQFHRVRHPRHLMMTGVFCFHWLVGEAGKCKRASRLSFRP